MGEMAFNRENLNKIRDGFYKAVGSASAALELIEFIKNNYGGKEDEYPPAVLGYFAALIGLRGKHSIFPLTSYLYVNKAIPKINQAVLRSPRCLECRFLRYAFFHQIPLLFGVRGYLDQDLAFVAGELEKRDFSIVEEKVQRDMVNYLISTRSLPAAERQRLERIRP